MLCGCVSSVLGAIASRSLQVLDFEPCELAQVVGKVSGLGVGMDRQSPALDDIMGDGKTQMNIGTGWLLLIANDGCLCPCPRLSEPPHCSKCLKYPDSIPINIKAYMHGIVVQQDIQNVMQCIDGFYITNSRKKYPHAPLSAMLLTHPPR